jgi:hypothetical protein
MKLFYLAAFSLIFFLTSCVKHPVEIFSPEVPANAFMVRTFLYPSTNTSETIAYNKNPDSLTIVATLAQDGKLLVTLDEPASKGKDYASFTIDANKIKPGYVGEYTIEPSTLSGLKGDVQVNYRYRKDTYSYVEFQPGNASGFFRISSYDAYRKTITGNYTFRINSLHDPKVGMNWVETRIDVSGYYEGLKVN